MRLAQKSVIEVQACHIVFDVVRRIEAAVKELEWSVQCDLQRLASHAHLHESMSDVCLFSSWGYFGTWLRCWNVGGLGSGQSEICDCWQRWRRTFAPF